ncbi:MAG: flagellar hook-length control protein FliK [Variibacter sp.]|nr:flagellar hook-length control protein FliK [Variibacter sp.]
MDWPGDCKTLGETAARVFPVTSLPSQAAATQPPFTPTGRIPARSEEAPSGDFENLLTQGAPVTPERSFMFRAAAKLLAQEGNDAGDAAPAPAPPQADAPSQVCEPLAGLAAALIVITPEQAKAPADGSGPTDAHDASGAGDADVSLETATAADPNVKSAQVSGLPLPEPLVAAPGSSPLVQLATDASFLVQQLGTSLATQTGEVSVAPSSLSVTTPVPEIGEPTAMPAEIAEVRQPRTIGSPAQHMQERLDPDRRKRPDDVARPVQAKSKEPVVSFGPKDKIETVQPAADDGTVKPPQAANVKAEAALEPQAATPSPAASLAHLKTAMQHLAPALVESAPGAGPLGAAAGASGAVASLDALRTAGLGHAVQAGDAAVATKADGSAIPLNGLAVEIAARALEGKRRFEIRLDPPELGRIDVRLDFGRDGQVTSRLVVERAETLDLLRRDSAGLERALEQVGIRTPDSGLQFSLRDQPGQRWAGAETPTRSAVLIVPDEDVTVREAVRRGYGALRGLGAGLDRQV